jgi:hypothetical protein
MGYTLTSSHITYTQGILQYNLIEYCQKEDLEFVEIKKWLVEYIKCITLIDDDIRNHCNNVISHYQNIFEKSFGVTQYYDSELFYSLDFDQKKDLVLLYYYILKQINSSLCYLSNDYNDGYAGLNQMFQNIELHEPNELSAIEIQLEKVREIWKILNETTLSLINVIPSMFQDDTVIQEMLTEYRKYTAFDYYNNVIPNLMTNIDQLTKKSIFPYQYYDIADVMLDKPYYSILNEEDEDIDDIDDKPEFVDEVDNDCSICFDEMISEVATLVCGHLYHHICITSWMTNDTNVQNSEHTNCPMCRETIQIESVSKKNDNHEIPLFVDVSSASDSIDDKTLVDDLQTEKAKQKKIAESTDEGNNDTTNTLLKKLFKFMNVDDEQNIESGLSEIGIVNLKKLLYTTQSDKQECHPSRTKISKYEHGRYNPYSLTYNHDPLLNNPQSSYNLNYHLTKGTDYYVKPTSTKITLPQEKHFSAFHQKKSQQPINEDWETLYDNDIDNIIDDDDDDIVETKSTELSIATKPVQMINTPNKKSKEKKKKKNKNHKCCIM